MMRLMLLTAATAAVLSLHAAYGGAPLPSCQVQKAREVSFRGGDAKDVLEVTIGTGPCEVATLTIVIRSDVGHVLYAYVQQFEQHVVHSADDPLPAQPVAFVDGVLANGVGSTGDLPRWLPPEAYEKEHAGVVEVDRDVYERLRRNSRPMFSHPTYHEGRRSVVWDETEGKSVTVVSGGT